MLRSASYQANSFYFVSLEHESLSWNWQLVSKNPQNWAEISAKLPQKSRTKHPSTITCSSFFDWKTSGFFFHRELKNEGILFQNRRNRTVMWQILPWNELTFLHNALHIWNWLKTTHWYKAILIFQTEVIQVFKDYLTIHWAALLMTFQMSPNGLKNDCRHMMFLHNSDFTGTWELFTTPLFLSSIVLLLYFWPFIFFPVYLYV